MSFLRLRKTTGKPTQFREYSFKRALILLIIFCQPVLSQDLPKIDGKINDDEWADAKIFNSFTIISPKTSEKYYDKTIVYLKQSNDAIYVAIKFWPRGRVIRQSLIRDLSTEEENEMFILLDLENKHKNGYFFAFSFLNNQRDMIIYNQRQLVSEWDWVWQNKSIVYREAKGGEPGYIESEVRIPVDKIQNKNSQQIGIDIQLFAYKPDGSHYFYSINPNSELLTIRGTYLWDIKPFDERANLSFNATPYLVANKFTDSTYRAFLGGEISVSLDKHKLKGTYNTDESTLEADPFDFSLYRRPILLQEKRPFFSKDLDIYQTPINIFYTRAIKDINYGLNYTYRSDRLKTGIAYIEEEAAPGESKGDRRRFFTFRPILDFQKFNVGSTILIDTGPLNDKAEKVYSVDGKVDLYSRWVFEPQFITNLDGQAYRGHLYYQFDGGGGPYADLLYNRFEKKFQTLTLFNNYGNDYDEIQVSGGYNFVRNRKHFSNVNIYGQYYRAQRLTDQFTHQENVATNVYYQANSWLIVNHYFEFNRPDERINDSTIVTHTNFLEDHTAKILFGNNSFSIGYNFGPYYGTFLHNPYADLSLSFFSRMGIGITLRRQKSNDIDQTIYRVKFDCRIIEKLYLRSFFQRDTGNDLTFWNSLIQYQFFAGSNLYLVLNFQRDSQQNDKALFENVGRYFKVAYEINF